MEFYGLVPCESLPNIFSYVGVVKKNTRELKVLVTSQSGVYYVWTTSHADAARFSRALYGELPLDQLEIANERQIEAGRGTLWVPNSSRVMEEVEFYGVVSGGQNNKTILIKRPSTEEGWFTVVVESSVVESLVPGSFLTVDSRYIFPARKDHVRAGLGQGKLERQRKV